MEFDILFPWRRATAPRPSPIALTRRDVRDLLEVDACIAAVEEAFRLHGAGRADPPGVLGIPVPEGGFHIKAGVLQLSRTYFAAKINANFPANPTRHGLPTIQGVIVLADAERGTLLALIESGEITALRTAAATAVAAKHLALPESRSATIVGCGVQGRAQLRALSRVRRLEAVHACDQDPARAEAYARQLAAELGVTVRAAPDVAPVARVSDIVVTCTPARRPVLGRDDVAPGAFIAAVGADHPEKQELDPALVAGSTLVVDVLEQAATLGDLHHALAAGVVTRDHVHAELGEVVAGRKPGRRSPQETIVFDSTGMALQDVAAAAAVYERAVQAGRGRPVPLDA